MSSLSTLLLFVKTIFCTIAILASVTRGNSQTCLPGGITFTTQEQIDAFPSMYSGCIQILGDVIINGNSSNIVNLNGLSQLTSIMGSLNIENTSDLTSVSGINNLTSVGGAIYISANAGLNMNSAMNSLATLGGSLTISNNGIVTLGGFGALTSIGGSIFIASNNKKEANYNLTISFATASFPSIFTWMIYCPDAN
ncbi:MAG: hypothetical protein ABIQ11_09280 [Saprospiraceae bacterium]